MSRSEDTGKFRCQAKVVRDSGAALLVQLDSGEKAWIPKSLIDDDSEVFEAGGTNSEGELIIPEWLAIKKGFV